MWIRLKTRPPTVTNPSYIRLYATRQAEEEEEATAERSAEDLATVAEVEAAAAAARTGEGANLEAAEEGATATMVAHHGHLNITTGPRHAGSSIRAQRKMEWISLRSHPSRPGTEVRAAAAAAGAGARPTRTLGHHPRP